MRFLFKLQLALSLAFFGLQLVGEYVKAVRVMLFSGLLVGSMLILLAITLLSLPKPQEKAAFYNVSLSGEKIAISYLTKSEQEAALEKYLQLAAIQPNHRDLLINISLLYLAEGNPEKAAEYWQAAEELDPNNPIFLNQPIVTE